jgi:hypothetical protein
MTITSEYEADSVSPGTNGTGTSLQVAQAPSPVPAPPSGPRLPKRLVWLDLPEEAYPGFKVKVWVNAPQRLFTGLTEATDADAIKGVLCQLIVEHNGWLDFDGNPLPPAADSRFWDEIPNELAAAVIVMLQGEVGKLATSLQMPRRGR